MIVATDYVGVATVISATAAAFVSVLVALRQTHVQRKLEDVSDKVTTPPGASTIGEIVAANDLTNGKS